MSISRRAVTAQFRNVTALNDSEQHVSLRRGLERALAAFRPADRQQHRTFDIGPLSRKTHTFIQLHGDVGTQQPLHFDGTFGRQFHLVPSICELNVTACSVTLRNFASDMT
jgi:hypothetical protein